LKGVASPSLLETYNAERQPVAAQLVKESNEMLRKHAAVWQALGIQPPGSTLEERFATMKVLKSASPEGRTARKLLKERIGDMHHETHALGIERGQVYDSNAIYAADEPVPFVKQGREAEDEMMFYEPSTYPGRRLPHVWLGTPVPGRLHSTLDVAGKGQFCLFTGIGGEAWKAAASNVASELRVPIIASGIGRGLDWEDTYLNWEDKRGVEEDGAVLVRPDLFVAWRAQTGGSEEACTEKLTHVMKAVLHL